MTAVWYTVWGWGVRCRSLWKLRVGAPKPAWTGGGRSWGRLPVAEDGQSGKTAYVR